MQLFVQAVFRPDTDGPAYREKGVQLRVRGGDGDALCFNIVRHKGKKTKKKTYYTVDIRKGEGGGGCGGGVDKHRNQYCLLSDSLGRFLFVALLSVNKQFLLIFLCVCPPLHPPSFPFLPSQTVHVFASVCCLGMSGSVEAEQDGVITVQLFNMRAHSRIASGLCVAKRPLLQESNNRSFAQGWGTPFISHFKQREERYYREHI